MGGYGSGYSDQDPRKPTTGDALRLDFRPYFRAGILAERGELRRIQISWKREGVISAEMEIEHDARRPGVVTMRFAEHLGDGALRERALQIPITSTLCHYGGERWWVMCPECGTRKAVLWFHRGEFRCRGCHGLAYASTVESKADRLLERCFALHRKLGVEHPGDARTVPPKPKGMRQATYDAIARDIRDSYFDALRSILGQS